LERTGFHRLNLEAPGLPGFVDDASLAVSLTTVRASVEYETALATAMS
jgi:hypothetical protein